MAISRNIASLLPRLADPESPPFGQAELTDTMIGQLVDLAERHGVLPVIARKLACRLPAAAESGLRLKVGQAMLLERKFETISLSLGQANVAFTIVKGPVFARCLYPHRADRPFTDIDLLIRCADIDQACQIMRNEGFRPERNETWDNSQRDQEFKWTLAENRSVLFELHGNLVHYPMLRRRVSFGYEELVTAGQGDAEAVEALLCLAIVHAACGHKFHRLQMIVDVLQAARRLPDEKVDNFVRVARGLGIALEASVSLSLAGRLFEDRRVAMLADRFDASTLAMIGCRLVSPDAVVQAADPRHRGSWARRKAFRLVQYLA